MVKLAPFDTARHLDNPEVRAHYLDEALQTGDNKLILRAIRNIVRAGKIAKIADETGLSRTSLYWKENASPEFITVLKAFAALGVYFKPMPSDERRARRIPFAKVTLRDERRRERRQSPAELPAGRATPARKPGGARH
jgi:probable addiction module antidote protein